MLKDLLPISGAQASGEQIMSPETYKFLLDRAISRELTFQTARAGGVELTPEQLAQREQVRQTILAQQGDPDKVVHLNLSGTLEQEIEFEQRDATSQLLLNSLLEKAGVTSPHVTDAQVLGYYEAHRSEFGPLPSAEAERAGAWQKIDLAIRNKLAPQMQVEYQNMVKKYMEGLRASAAVTVL
jgi:hypothetical protein